MPGYMDQTAGGSGFIPGAPTIAQAPMPWQEQEAKIKRTLAMAEALRKNTAQPEGQMVSGHYVAPSWAEQLAPLFNIGQARYAETQADKEQAALQGAQEQGAQQWMQQMPQAREVTSEAPFQAPGIDAADAAQAGAGAKVLTKAMQQPTMQERMLWAQEGQRNPLTKALAAAYGADTLIKEPERIAGREERTAAREDRLAQQQAQMAQQRELAEKQRELQAAIAAGNLSMRQAQLEMTKFMGQQTLALRADAAARGAEANADRAEDRKFRGEDRMKNDFEQVTKSSREGLDATQKVDTILQGKAPGTKLTNVEQQALITLFNKFLDPGSVVREGEFNRMQQGMGWAQQVQNWQDKIMAGSIITPQMAAEIGRVSKLYQQDALENLRTQSKTYEGVAQRRGYDIGSIITNPTWRTPQEAAGAPAGVTVRMPGVVGGSSGGAAPVPNVTVKVKGS